MSARVLVSWSSGKDSAWSLHELRRDAGVEVVGLLTTVNRVHQRVAMHGVRRSVLELQADAAGLPLWEIPIPSPCSNEVYEAAMGEAMDRARESGVEAVAFGDLFLEEIRRYREDRLAGTGIVPLFPLWGRPTDRLAREMLGGGLRARIATVDPRQLDPSFAGREFELSLLSELPTGVDPCGERGEFHTVVYDGPMFRRPVALGLGVVVERDGFVFADFEPLPELPPPRGSRPASDRPEALREHP